MLLTGFCPEENCSNLSLKTSRMADAYRVLNVLPTASSQEIRRAYVILACQHHPSNSERTFISPSATHTQFRLVAEAFFLVGDDLRRELYNLIRSSSLNKPAYSYRHDLDGLESQARLDQFTRRSRACSELTIDLRVGLPSELRTLLVELDPIKLFNRVVNQIDQERKKHTNPAERSTSLRLSPTLTGVNTLSDINTSKSKYLHSFDSFLNESKFQTSHSRSKSNTTRQDTVSKQQQLLNLYSPHGILRDENKTQFRQPPSNLTESLKRDLTDSYRRMNTEFHSDPIASRGHSRNSNGATSASTVSSQRNNRSRRVSFSNDVIASDELKQAREVVQSFKSEIARKSSKPILTSSSQQHPQTELNNTIRGGLVNNHCLATTTNKTSPPSSHLKTAELLSDLSLYRDSDRRIINSFPKEFPTKPIAMEQGGASLYRSNLGERDNDYYSSVASSAPTGYLARFRDEYTERRNGINLKKDVLDPPSNYSSSFADRQSDQLRPASRSPRRDGN